MNEQEFAELSAGAALHALSPDEERRFRAALAVHPEWRGIAQDDAEAAATLADAVEPIAPPDRVRSALFARIAETAPDDGSAPAERTTSAEPIREQTRPRMTEESEESRAGHPEAGSPSLSTAEGQVGTEAERLTGQTRSRRLLFALAACIVLLVGIGVGTIALNGFLARPAPVIALEQIEGAADAEQASIAVSGGGTAIAHWSASLGRAVLVTEDIAVPAPDEIYELWFVRDDGAVSAGTFSVDGGHAIAELKGEMRAGDAIAVTVEPAGGSPTGQPTSDPVIVIPTA